MMSALREEDFLYARLSLHRRAVERARKRIARAQTKPGRWAVSFSAGKDSTVTLALVREQAPDTLAVMVDSGAEFPEALTFAGATPNVVIEPAVIPLLDMYRMTGEHGAAAEMPDTHWGRDDIKASVLVMPMQRLYERHSITGVYTGLRGDESSARETFGATRSQPWRGAGDLWRCEPLIDWTEADVWAYIASHALPYCPVYDRYAEIGAPRHVWRVAPYAGGTAIGYGRWAWLRRGWPELWEQFAAAFPYVRSYV